MIGNLHHIAAETLAPAGDIYKEIYARGSTEDIIKVLLAADQVAASYTSEFAEKLRGKTVRATGKKIHAFIQEHITYQEDPSGQQDIKSPSQLFESGIGDCKSFSLFAGSVLRNLQILYFYRFVAFNGEDAVTHVYVVALDEQGEQIIIDAVPPIAFDEEVSHTKALDYYTEGAMPAGSSIGAVPTPSSPPPFALAAILAGAFILLST